MLPIRNAVPVRTCTRKYENYRSYKEHLQKDFNKRCGYCDDRDVICGGKKGFHIDHFRPQTPFKHLENDYSNLVYACSYCNGGKSNDWPSGDEKLNIIDSKGYIDPCETDFDNHLERYDYGKIRPKTEVGKYMFNKLKLGLKRHELAWKYEQLENLLSKLSGELESFSDTLDRKNLLRDKLQMVILEYLKYKKMFEETL